MPVQQVFLSYASEDSSWKRLFADPKWFGKNLGNAIVKDYEMARDELPFGPLGEWIKNHVDEAAAFVAIISKNYLQKADTEKEWTSAISKMAEGNKLIFVPVLIDAEALDWWNVLKTVGPLPPGLSADYEAANFVLPGGITREIYARDHEIPEDVKKIERLASLIRDYSIDVPPPPPEQESVVILGHPSNEIVPDEVTIATEQLYRELTKSERLCVTRWPNQWRARQNVIKDLASALSANATFIQPVRDSEIYEYIDQPSRTRNGLRSLASGAGLQSAPGLESCKIVLWAPKLSSEPPQIAFPSASDMLRKDDVGSITQWLLHEDVPEVAVYTLKMEELVDVPDAPRRREMLSSGLKEIVGSVIKPTPYETWFSGGQLIEQLTNDPPKRAIIAVHDLNTYPTAKNLMEARKRLETKLSDYSKELRASLRKANRSDLPLFRAVLLVINAGQLAYPRYPSPRLQEWALLRFVELPDGSLKRNPEDEGAFLTYLREWVTSL
jgi:hypothetical protein